MGTIFIKRKCTNPIYFKKFLIITSIYNNRFNLIMKIMKMVIIQKINNKKNNNKYKKKY